MTDDLPPRSPAGAEGRVFAIDAQEKMLEILCGKIR